MGNHGEGRAAGAGSLPHLQAKIMLLLSSFQVVKAKAETKYAMLGGR